MKFGILIETNEPEKAWNGMRFANASLAKGHEVKVFLMSAGVEIEGIRHEKYDAKAQLDSFVGSGGTVLACGTCIKSRNSQGSDVCPLSTMNDCIAMVEWAERVITF